jgi:hypothetical protein
MGVAIEPIAGVPGCRHPALAALLRAEELSHQPLGIRVQVHHWASPQDVSSEK